MPKKLFFELNEDKRIKITTVGLSEFATYGYTNSSTNRIVKNSGISKGSLYKYFTNKEEFYFYILDTVTSEFVECLEGGIDKLSVELFQRITEYATLEFSWHISNPDKSKLIIEAFKKSNNEIYLKTIKRYELKEINIFYRLLEDVDFSNYRWDKQKIINILKWILRGFNEDFLQNNLPNNYSLENIQKEYLTSLREYTEILKISIII